MVWSDDIIQQLEATKQIRKLLNIERSPPVEEEVIQSGVVPRLVEFLLRDDFPQLQYEAAWALTNIAAGTCESTKLVIDHGAVPMFVKLLSSSSNHVREQVRIALPALERLVFSNDEEVLTNACWALSNLSHGTNEKIQAVIETGICGRLVQLLQHPSPSVLIPVIHTVGNIATGDNMQTQAIINHGSLPYLLSLLINNHKNSIKRKACWAISKITAGNRETIQAVIEAGLIAPLVNLLQNDDEFKIKKVAAWALSNATICGTHEQIKYLVSHGCIKPLCDLLVCPDPRIVYVCLKGLENFLKVGEAEKRFCNTGDVNLYAQMIDDAEGLEKIENLQSHDNKEIYEKVVQILKTYWLEDEDQTLPPGHGRQDHDPKRKIVRLYGLSTPWHARVCLESEFGAHSRIRRKKSRERWNPLLGFSDMFSRVGSAIKRSFWDLKP